MSSRCSHTKRSAANRFRPHVEALEDRRLLSTFTVVTTVDNGDNVSPTGGSLRAAILTANTTRELDTIDFLLGPTDPGRVYYLDDGVAGRVSLLNVTRAPATATDDDHLPGIDRDWPHSWWSIHPPTPLPELLHPVKIDGTTQPSGRPNEPPEVRDSYLRVELDGEAAGPANGLLISGGSSTVRGLVVNRFGGSGFHLQGAGDNFIERNFVGIDISGTLDLGNRGDGVLVKGGSGNRIGGLTRTPGTGAGNVISGNDANGISVAYDRVGPGIVGTVVQGNILGLSASGKKPLGNTHAGFRTADAGALIGGTDSMARNIITGNEYGILLSNSGSDLGAVIEGNSIGTDITGNVGFGNRADGVNVGSAPGTRVGGTAPGAGNVISGNRTGVFINGISHPAIGGRYNCVVQGNRIGLNAAGLAAVGNHDGVVVVNGDNLIGGAEAAARNFISGNRGNGIIIRHAAATGNEVLGNTIGTDVTATSRTVGNLADGVLIADGAAATIIGLNFIPFNGRSGVRLSNASSNSIVLNVARENGQDGISLENADNNLIFVNTCLSNRRDGLRVDAASSDNWLVANDLRGNLEHDAHDDSEGGGTAGTANFWLANVGGSENRRGLLI